MTNNLEGETEPIEVLKADLQSVKNELLEKLKKVVAAETEEIKNSQKQKFDEIAEKLRSIEDAVSKNYTLSNNSSNATPKSAKRFMLKHEFKDLKNWKISKYLAAQSTYFKTLFLGSFSESKKSEIASTGIEADEFQHFLEVLYGEFAIDDSTVEGILMIADFYYTPMVTKKCEMFLLKESKKEFNKKLQLSAKYRLEELKDQCLSKINTVDNIRELLPGNLHDLDPSVALTILQKCVSETES